MKSQYGMETKTCSICMKELPRNSEFFNKSGAKYPDGSPKFRGNCRTCDEDRVKKYNRGEHRRQYYLKNDIKMREAVKNYRIKHKDKINAALLRRLKNDPTFKMRHSLSTKLRKVLAVCGLKKTRKTMELLGCDMPTFKRHIESLFSEGMTWENYGNEGWHIDHIKPCACFDLSDIEQQKECFHYTNLRPLWGDLNIAKGSMYCGVRYFRRPEK